MLEISGPASTVNVTSTGVTSIAGLTGVITANTFITTLDLVTNSALTIILNNNVNGYISKAGQGAGTIPTGGTWDFNNGNFLHVAEITGPTGGTHLIISKNGISFIDMDNTKMVLTASNGDSFTFGATGILAALPSSNTGNYPAGVDVGGLWIDTSAPFLSADGTSGVVRRRFI